MRTINCSKCKKSYGVRNSYYIKRIEAAGSLGLLKETYKCRICRKEEREEKKYKLNRQLESIQHNIKESDIYTNLRIELQNQILLFEKQNMTLPVVQQSFLDNIKNILASFYITEYNFNVDQGRIRSVLIKNLPLLGDMTIEI